MAAPLSPLVLLRVGRLLGTADWPVRNARASTRRAMPVITEERTPVVQRQSSPPRVDRIVLVVGAVVAAVAVPSLSIAPTVGWDDSWRVGIILAASHHVQWGPHLAFTYGPLGYLIESTVVSARLGYVALAFQILVRIALYLSLAFGLRRRLPTV